MAEAARSQRRSPLCLTDLPDEVVLVILKRLGLRDAVRTSVLSRAWRHRWRHLAYLNFPGGVGVASAAQSVLLRHLAQVRGFALDACSPPLPEAEHPRLDDLVGHLSHRHALRTFILRVPFYKLHSSIFSCDELVVLDLKGCLLPDSTPGLLALRNLIKLRMHYTRLLTPHLNSAQFDALAALISCCPGLKILGVIVAAKVAGVTLKISAPCLRHLEIRVCSADWMLEFQSLLPDLAEATLRFPFFRYAWEEGSKVQHILQSISQVEKLELLNYGNPVVSFQAMVSFKMPTKFENLQYLTTEADLGDAAHIVLILHLLRCCPNIRGLKIKFPVSSHGFHHHFEETQEFWNTHGYGDLFRCLRIMELINVYLSYNELQFIKLVLSKSQVLENFTIVHCTENGSSSLEACIEILKFNRVSQVAQIKYEVASEH